MEDDPRTKTMLGHPLGQQSMEAPPAPPGGNPMRPLKRATRVLMCVAVVVGVAGLSGQTRDPRTGTWVLNVAKSTYKPGPPPKTQTVRVEPSGQGEHVRSEALNSNGTKVVTEYTAAYDGTDYPLKGSLVANTVMLKRIDSNTTERFDKKDGQLMLVYRRVVSPDGKVMTVTVQGVNAQGQQVNNTVVFEKRTAKPTL
jgi:hypothetical protein